MTPRLYSLAPSTKPTPTSSAVTHRVTPKSAKLHSTPSSRAGTTRPPRDVVSPISKRSKQDLPVRTTVSPPAERQSMASVTSPTAVRRRVAFGGSSQRRSRLGGIFAQSGSAVTPSPTPRTQARSEKKPASRYGAPKKAAPARDFDQLFAFDGSSP